MFACDDQRMLSNKQVDRTRWPRYEEKLSLYEPTWLTDRPTEWSADLLNEQPAYWPTSWVTDQLSDQLDNQLTK